MTTAKITRCNHYFHGVCLRKWLYVQDRCPLCHEIIMNPDEGPVTEGTPAPSAAAPAVMAANGDVSVPANADSASNSAQAAGPAVAEPSEHGWEADAATVGYRRREVR